MNALKKLNDKAYMEHVHAVAATDNLLKTVGFNPPSSLITIQDREYRTVFYHPVKNLFALITTKSCNGECYIVISDTKTQQEAENIPSTQLTGRKFRLKSIPHGVSGFSIREDSVRKAVVALGLIKDCSKIKKIVEDCVKYDDQGQRYIDYNNLDYKKKIREEAPVLSYGSMGSFKVPEQKSKEVL